MTTNYEPLWHWVREREAIRIKKESGQPQPWTAYPILAIYRFCNVRREDDLVTRYIDKNIRVHSDHPYLWLMLAAARQINWPATLAALMDDGRYPGAWPWNARFKPELMGNALEDMASSGQKVFTGAYTITAPPQKGAKKTHFVAEQTLGGLWNRRNIFEDYFTSTPQEQRKIRRVHELLMRSPGWGPFMAYQAVVDMRFTPLLSQATDISTWAAAGPGTIRGLNRCHGRPVDQALSQDQALREIRAIFALVTPETGVAMDFSDVPNILCETDKYLRVKNGEGKPRALYIPGRGA